MANFTETHNIQNLTNNNIYNYSQKKQVKVTNHNVNLLDKNFTIFISFSSISSYSFKKHNVNFNKSTIIQIPYNNIDINDYFYNNLDAFDQQTKIKFENIFPIFSLSEKCLYDSTIHTNNTYYNCFFVYINNGKIYWIINDSTSKPELVKLSIDISNIEYEKLAQYHIVLTRDDDYFIMHLIRDEYSTFTNNNIIDSYKLPYKQNIPSNAIELTDTYLENNKLELNTIYYYKYIDSNDFKNKYFDFQTLHQIKDDIEILVTYQSANYCVPTIEFFLPILKYMPSSETTINKITFSAELTTVYHNGTDNIQSPVAVLTTNDSNQGNFEKLQSVNPLIKIVNSNTLTYDTNVLQNIGPYNILFKFNEDYGSIQFYNTLQKNTICALRTYNGADCYLYPKQIMFIITTDKNKYNLNDKYINQTIDNTSVYTKINNNLNISNILLNNTMSIGYIERYPVDTNTNNLLFKNSFKGYISELYILENQTQYKKFNNIANNNYFNYKTNIKKCFSSDFYQDYDNYFIQKNNFKKIGYYNLKFHNSKNIPFKYGIESEYSHKFNLTAHDNLNCLEVQPNNCIKNQDFKDKDDFLSIKQIDNIYLIDKNLINDTNTFHKTDFISHYEFPVYNQEESINDYHGNNLNDSTNTTFCIFNFEIFKDHNTYDNLVITSDSTIEIINHYRILLDTNMNIIIFDDTKSYQYYKDYNNNIELINISNFNNYKNQIITTLNQILSNEIILNNYISKFYITNLRNNKYMFIYVLNNTISVNDSFINLTYQIDKIKIDAPDLSLTKFLNHEIYTYPKCTILRNFYYGKLCDISNVKNDIIYLNKIIYSYDKNSKLLDIDQTSSVYYSLDLYNIELIDINKLDKLKLPPTNTTHLSKENFILTKDSTQSIIDHDGTVYYSDTNTSNNKILTYIDIKNLITSSNAIKFDFNKPLYINIQSPTLIDSTNYTNDKQKLNILTEFNIDNQSIGLDATVYQLDDTTQNIYYNNTILDNTKNYQCFVTFKNNDENTDQLKLIKYLNDNFYNIQIFNRLYPTNMGTINNFYTYYKNKYKQFYAYKDNLNYKSIANIINIPNNTTQSYQLLYNELTTFDYTKEYKQEITQNTNNLNYVLTPIEINYNNNTVNINFIN